MLVSCVILLRLNPIVDTDKKIFFHHVKGRNIFHKMSKSVLNIVCNFGCSEVTSIQHCCLEYFAVTIKG